MRQAALEKTHFDIKVSLRAGILEAAPKSAYYLSFSAKGFKLGVSSTPEACKKLTFNQKKF